MKDYKHLMKKQLLLVSGKVSSQRLVLIKYAKKTKKEGEKKRKG